MNMCCADCKFKSYYIFLTKFINYFMKNKVRRKEFYIIGFNQNLGCSIVEAVV